MPESFEYAVGSVLRKGKVLDGWSRIEPVREVSILSANSLGSVSTTAPRTRSAPSALDGQSGFR